MAGSIDIESVESCDCDDGRAGRGRFSLVGVGFGALGREGPSAGSLGAGEDGPDTDSPLLLTSCLRTLPQRRGSVNWVVRLLWSTK